MSWGALDELPRSQARLPAPAVRRSTGSTGATALRTTTAVREETLRSLREKLSEVQEENSLLGGLVKELKGERDGLQRRLSTASKHHSEASGKAAAAAAQADALAKEQQRLKADVSRLTSVVHSHSQRLTQAKAHQQELEDVVLDMRAELEDTRGERDAARRAADAAAHRATAAEAKLGAAGLGALPKMGPTAEQLVINSTQRVRELSEELAAARAAHEQQAAHLQQQLESAHAAARKAQQQAQERALELQDRDSQLQEVQAQVLGLQQQLVQAQRTVVDAQELAQAKQQLQQLRQGMAAQSRCLEQQVGELQDQMAACEAAHASSLQEQQHHLAALRRENRELSSALVAVRQQESAARLALSDAFSKSERLRAELLKCVGELQSQLAAEAAAGQAQAQAQQQLRAQEASAAAARAEAAESRQQLVELAAATMAELREQVAGGAAAFAGLPAEMQDAHQIPAATQGYIKVLEHAVVDCEQRCKQLLADSLAAAAAEREARASLAGAREAQAAAERGLQQQTQRLLAAERMRLADLKEQQGLERRLTLAHQECWRLRDALLDKVASGSDPSCGARSGSSTSSSLLEQLGLLTSAAAAGASAAAAAAGGAADDAWQQASCAAADAPAAGSAQGGWPEHTSQNCVADVSRSPSPSRQALWPGQQQLPGAAPASPAGSVPAALDGVAASSAATLERYQHKLAQLRAMQGQLMARSLGCGGTAAVPTAVGAAGSGREGGSGGDISAACAHSSAVAEQQQAAVPPHSAAIAARQPPHQAHKVPVQAAAKVAAAGRGAHGLRGRPHLQRWQEQQQQHVPGGKSASVVSGGTAVRS